MTTGDPRSRAEAAFPVQAEFTVEPFVEGAPGDHVTAAIDAVRRAGVDVEIGPFGTAIAGDLDVVADGLAAAIRAAAGSGAERFSVQITFRTDGPTTG